MHGSRIASCADSSTVPFRIPFCSVLFCSVLFCSVLYKNPHHQDVCVDRAGFCLWCAHTGRSRVGSTCRTRLSYCSSTACELRPPRRCDELHLCQHTHAVPCTHIMLQRPRLMHAPFEPSHTLSLCRWAKVHTARLRPLRAEFAIFVALIRSTRLVSRPWTFLSFAVCLRLISG